MSSKAEKLRSKRERQRGRPIKEGVARTDSGRVSRSRKPADPADKVARDARMKIFGVTAQHASTSEASTFMGRLSLLGTQGGGISVDQYEALKRFADDRERYMLSINAPDSLRSKGGGGSSSDNEAWKETAKRVYLFARDAIQRAQNEHPGANLWAVVQYVVIDNLDFSHMIGDLRLLGNALQRHYQGLDRVRKSA